MLAPFVELGYRHVIFGFPAPYDEETMTRLTTEVRPALERHLAGIRGWAAAATPAPAELG